MRDWTITDQKDQALLREVQQRMGCGAWLPWPGSHARAKRLCKDGLLVKAGVAAMPPHVLYTLTDKGVEELAVATRLDAGAQRR